MKKALVGLVVCLFALVAYAQSVATDQAGSAIINHSNGVLVFPFGKLQPARTSGIYSQTLRYYSTEAAYPTSFVPSTVTFDAGCQMYEMTASTVLSARTAGKAFYCDIEQPIATLDAGTFTVVRDVDGGYAMRQCPAYAVVGGTPWTAFCRVQGGVQP